MRLITPELVLLGMPAASRADAIAALADTLAATDRLADLDGYLKDVHTREGQLATGLPGGVAIPHARSAHVTVPSVAFGRSEQGIDWGVDDGPAKLIFLIAVPSGAPTDHLAILAKLARRLTHQSFRQQLGTLEDPAAVADLLQESLLRA
ncbi:MAG: fructose PTS transporter subunit IIA [Dermatophilus congolensis]|nr:fructose PTS transporter subunit IIA [Dermatophilus congolensis]